MDSDFYTITIWIPKLQHKPKLQHTPKYSNYFTIYSNIPPLVKSINFPEKTFPCGSFSGRTPCPLAQSAVKNPVNKQKIKEFSLAVFFVYLCKNHLAINWMDYYKVFFVSVLFPGHY
jgi:hypothetical protein